MLENVTAPPGSNLTLTALDLRCVFEEDPAASGHSYHITAPTVMLGCAIIKSYIRRAKLSMLCGDLLDFRPSFKADYEGEGRGRSLQRLLGPDAAPGKGYGDYLDIILKDKTSILLPYNLSHHYLLLEVVLRSDDGRMIKVWDGANAWGKGDPRRREEIKTIRSVFFAGDLEVPVYVWRKGDPLYGQCAGAGAFLFLFMCYRVLGMKPKEWGAQDEAVARNFLWTCILNGDIATPPRLKL